MGHEDLLTDPRFSDPKKLGREPAAADGDPRWKFFGSQVDGALE